MADALMKLYGAWKLLRWPGMPPREPDWSDVETAFKAGYYEGRAEAARGMQGMREAQPSECSDG